MPRPKESFWMPLNEFDTMKGWNLLRAIHRYPRSFIPADEQVVGSDEHLVPDEVSHFTQIVQIFCSCFADDESIQCLRHGARQRVQLAEFK